MDMEKVALVVAAVGAVNSGLVAVAKYNLVESISGTYANIIYIVIGVAGVYVLYDYFSR